jgi:hypothetical protein
LVLGYCHPVDGGQAARLFGPTENEVATMAPLTADQTDTQHIEKIRVVVHAGYTLDQSDNLSPSNMAGQFVRIWSLRNTVFPMGISTGQI